MCISCSDCLPAIEFTKRTFFIHYTFLFSMPYENRMYMLLIASCRSTFIQICSSTAVFNNLSFQCIQIIFSAIKLWSFFSLLFCYQVDANIWPFLEIYAITCCLCFSHFVNVTLCNFAIKFYYFSVAFVSIIHLFLPWKM